MKHSQLDLFDEASPIPASPIPSSLRSPIDGLAVHLDQHCRCGATLAVIAKGKGPHVAALRCPDCDRFRQWLPQKVCEFLTELVARCGRPTEPIEIYEQVQPDDFPPAKGETDVGNE